MPNWCENKMTIRHTDPSMIKRARDAWMDHRFLKDFIPIPQELCIVAGRVGADDNPEQVLLVAQQESNQKKYGYQDWYTYCVNEWGTKWDIGYDEGEGNAPYNENQAEFTVRYNSAWSPPEAACFKLVAMGFDITNYYYEPGMGFCGVFKDGEDHQYSTGEAPKEIQEMFSFDVPEVDLTRDELINKLLQDDIKGTMDDLKCSIEAMAMNGVTGYKDMSDEELKEEFINRELHENEDSGFTAEKFESIEDLGEDGEIVAPSMFNADK